MKSENSISDLRLWRIAEQRASFKLRALTYLFVDLSMWLLWFFTTENRSIADSWAWYPTAGLAIGLSVVAFRTYRPGKELLVEREYAKLRAQA